MLLELKKRHFVNASFIDAQNCPIAKALKEIFPRAMVRELVDEARVNGKSYPHTPYRREDFQHDMGVLTSNYTVIRTINIPNLEINKSWKTKLRIFWRNTFHM